MQKAFRRLIRTAWQQNIFGGNGDMKQKGNFSKRAGDFLAGRGFYIVLILCVAVIGASAWAMLRDTTDPITLDLPVMGEVDNYAQQPPRLPALGNEGRPTVTPRPSPSPVPQDEETFFGLGEPEEAPPPETPTPPPPAEQPAVQEPIQFIWPVAGRQIEAAHCHDTLVFNRTLGDWRVHLGVDIAADLGEPVLAVAAGTVERIFHDDLLGTTVIIDHGGGLQSLYANLAEVPVVTEGEQITMGMPIGAVGTTALAKSGVVHHLHLEIIENGVRVDPLLFLPAR